MARVRKTDLPADLLAQIDQSAAKPRRESKYNARRVTIQGHTFHSKKEARRFLELQELEKQGVIADLKLQVRYKLVVNGVHICDYIPDFEYTEQGKTVTEDVKGRRTREYILKRKLMKAVHNITIRET